MSSIPHTERYIYYIYYIYSMETQNKEMALILAEIKDRNRTAQQNKTERENTRVYFEELNTLGVRLISPALY